MLRSGHYINHYTTILKAYIYVARVIRIWILDLKKVLTLLQKVEICNKTKIDSLNWCLGLNYQCIQLDVRGLATLIELWRRSTISESWHPNNECELKRQKCIFSQGFSGIFQLQD